MWVRRKEEERGSTGRAGYCWGQHCKQTVGKKATSYIIEDDVKASSLQGCQCQEAEPGWEQGAPPCLPLRWAAIYIVNTLAPSLSLSLSVHLWLSSPIFCVFCTQFVSPSRFFSLIINAQQWSWETERWDIRGVKNKKNRLVVWTMSTEWYKIRDTAVQQGHTKQYCVHMYVHVCVCTCMMTNGLGQPGKIWLVTLMSMLCVEFGLLHLWPLAYIDQTDTSFLTSFQL